MKAFWWFEENAIAGMARPGFNGTRWFDFSYEEAILVGWIGQFPSGAASLSDFRRHVQSYGAKILKFYQIEGAEAERALAAFLEPEYLTGIFQRVAKASNLLEGFEVSGSHMHFTFSKERLHWEIESLKKNGISKIVSLTENHNDKEILREHFDAYHFSINDLDAPTSEQVHQLAAVIRDAKKNREKIAVHCLAGIGRTSTMLITAHMALGEPLEKMKALIARQNPVFVFAGRQAEFIESMARKAPAI